MRMNAKFLDDFEIMPTLPERVGNVQFAISEHCFTLLSNGSNEPFYLQIEPMFNKSFVSVRYIKRPSS
jgi:hypothetical protein